MGDVDADLYHSKPDLRIRADINLIPDPRYDPRQKKNRIVKGSYSEFFKISHKKLLQIMVFILDGCYFHVAHV